MPGLNVKIGVHVSISGTIDLAWDRARDAGCDTFQMFTRNPRGWKYKALKASDVKEFHRKSETYSLDPAVAHMPYLPNLSSPNKALYNKSLKSLITELNRCGQLGIRYLVTHLGSHLGKGAYLGLERLTNAINEGLRGSVDNVMLLLENTAGTKNSMGSSFEEIKKILSKVDDERGVGVCFDTCHAFAAGYDIRTPQGVRDTMNLFSRILGYGSLKVVHLNDSKGELGCGRDRHEHLGLGYIGEAGMRAILKHEALSGLPFIMETPIDERRDDKGNIKKARELAS